MESKDAKKALRAQIRRARRERAAADDAATTRESAASALAQAVLGHLDAAPPAPAMPPETLPASGTRSPALPAWGEDGVTVALFRATPTEPPTHAIAAALMERGARVIVPRTRDDLDLEWHELLPSAVASPPRPNTAPPTPTTPAHAGHTADEAAELPGDDGRDDEGPSLGVDGISHAAVILTPGLAVDHAGHRLGQGGGCYDRALGRRADGAPVATILHDDELVPAVPVEGHDSPVDAVVTPARGWTTLPIGPDHLGD